MDRPEEKITKKKVDNHYEVTLWDNRWAGGWYPVFTAYGASEVEADMMFLDYVARKECMEKQTEENKALFFIANKLMGDGEFDSWKPVNAQLANQLAEIAYMVTAEGKTLAEAYKKVTLKV